MIAVIADDLTGANDTGVQYKKSGYKTIVKINSDFNMNDIENYDVVSINADSRILDMKSGYIKVLNIADRFNDIEYEYIYKKMDSVFRGNIGTEIEAVLDAVNPDITLAAPSFPANRRVVKNGYSYMLNDEGELGKSIINVTELIQRELNRSIENISLDIVREGTDHLISYIESRLQDGVNVFLADAINDGDLKIIAEVYKKINKKVVFCGSAGLAQQLAIINPKMTEIDYVNEDGITLLVVGTRNKSTLSQTNNIKEAYNLPVFDVNVSEIIDGKQDNLIKRIIDEVNCYITKGNKLIILKTSKDDEIEFEESLKQDSNEVMKSQKIVKTLGAIVKQLNKLVNLKYIVSTGGDTSMQICKSLNAQGIELIDEIEPGIPI
ncbi:MAG: four-carbon acid sugar kinase family protein, partial [Tissierellia bacterium]|nr:four-carbon acid sugar kinase family protein [Tissierellia bacterium]